MLRFRVEWLQTRVSLQGDYLPPFGRFGALFDRFVGHRLALATAGDLVDRLARALEALWAARTKDMTCPVSAVV